MCQEKKHTVNTRYTKGFVAFDMRPAFPYTELMKVFIKIFSFPIHLNRFAYPFCISEKL
jgi:hypothetical protein